MKIQNPKSKIENGFTLLEVVVAMAIVGLGVVTVLEVFSLGLRLSARSYGQSEAMTYGLRVLDESLARREVQDGSEEGSFGERYRWRMQVETWRDEAQLSSLGWELKEVTLQMERRDGGVGKRIEMKTLRLVRKKGL